MNGASVFVTLLVLAGKRFIYLIYSTVWNWFMLKNVYKYRCVKAPEAVNERNSLG